MRLCPAAPFVVLLLTALGGCSSDGSDGDPETLDDGSEIASGSPFEPGMPADQGPPVETGTDLLIADIEWELIDYRTNDGEDVPAAFTPPYSLTLSGNEDVVRPLSVSFPTCGLLEGDYRIEGGELVVIDVQDFSGEIDCGPPFAGDIQTDAVLIELFMGTRSLSAEVVDDVLTLTSTSGARARFTNGDRSAADPDPDNSSAAGCTPLPVWLAGDRLSYRYADRNGTTTDIDILFSDVDDRRALLDVTEGGAVYQAAFQVGCDDTQGEPDPEPAEEPSAALQQLFDQFEGNAFLRRILRQELPRVGDGFVQPIDRSCDESGGVVEIGGVPGEVTTCTQSFNTAATGGLFEVQSSTFTGDRNDLLQINVNQVERYDNGDTASLTLQSAELQFPF